MQRTGRKVVKKQATLAEEEGVTPAIAWTVLRVSEWIRELGYPKYVVSVGEPRKDRLI